MQAAILDWWRVGLWGRKATEGSSVLAVQGLKVQAIFLFFNSAARLTPLLGSTSKYDELC